MTPLAVVDQRLEKCRLELERRPENRSTTMLMIDDLLDERNELLGIRHATPVTVTKVAICSVCYSPAARAPGGFIDCSHCDRSTCQCGVKVPGRRDQKCPKGHWLDRTSN